MEITALNALIRNRRSIFPVTYTDKAIEKENIEMILENANWAPTHKKAEPWRFIVLQGDQLKKLSEYMGKHYQENTPAESYSEIKHKKKLNNPLKADCIIAIIMEDDPSFKLPEWEQVAATACAVQNMWLTATALGIGAYWSSPKAITSDNSFFELEEHQKCLGLFYMGYPKDLPYQSTRGPIADKVEWMGG